MKKTKKAESLFVIEHQYGGGYSLREVVPDRRGFLCIVEGGLDATISLAPAAKKIYHAADWCKYFWLSKSDPPKAITQACAEQLRAEEDKLQGMTVLYGHSTDVIRDELLALGGIDFGEVEMFGLRDGLVLRNCWRFPKDTALQAKALMDEIQIDPYSKYSPTLGCDVPLTTYHEFEEDE